MIPSPAECFRLMDEYHMLGNIKAHSVMVAKVAEFLARGLIAKGAPLSAELTIAAALLHDIGKTPCLHTDLDHAVRGMEICRRHNFQELAAIVEEHVILKNGVPAAGVSEKEIVYYADKRINHDRIVSLDDRLLYILQRYGNNDAKRCQAIRRNFDICKTIEERLCAALALTPADIEKHVYETSTAFV